MKFYLGTHEPCWLKRTDVPMFISRRRLARQKVLPRAVGEWCLDSGGFTELAMMTNPIEGFSLDAYEYADEVRMFRDRVGGLNWAATQDWMCEPFVVAKTGKTVGYHQHMTINSYMDLTSIAPDIHWLPVIQGYTLDEYLFCVDQYRDYGVDLASLPVVGVGSVCRRQATEEAGEIVRTLADLGIRLHGFGLKLDAMRRFSPYLESADSMAWSVGARRSAPLPGCTHKSCANCMKYALEWRGRILEAIESPSQLVFSYPREVAS